MALTDNLDYYWKLDENSGNVADSVGGNTGTNTDATFANGKINNGASFNGTTSKFVLASNITMPTDLTINVWVKMSATGAHSFFGDSDVAVATYWTVNSQGTNKVRFQWSLSGTGHREYDTDNEVLDTSNWHMVTITQVGTGAPTFYIDGSSVASSLAGTGGAATKPSAQGSAIGLLGASTSQYMQGMLDELGIWSRELSSSEVSQLYNGGAGLQYPFVATNTGLNLLLLGVG